MLESKRRAIIFLSLSFLLAVVAGFVFLQKVRALNADLGGMTEVYIANADIPSRAVIQPEHVTTMEIPNRYVTDSYIVSALDLEHKVSVVPLSEGDIITKNVLKPVTNVTRENHRLVTMFGSEEISFDEELEALDRVDIIVSHQFDDEEKTETFMTDVLVARVAKEDNKFKGVQLEVSEEDAPKLIHMQNYADRIRILKANVEQDDPDGEDAHADEEQKQTDETPDEEVEGEKSKGSKEKGKNKKNIKNGKAKNK